jgi:hypothetical protein
MDLIEVKQVQRLGIKSNFLEYSADATILQPLSSIVSRRTADSYQTKFSQLLKELNKNIDDYQDENYEVQQ